MDRKRRQAPLQLNTTTTTTTTTLETKVAQDISYFDPYTTSERCYPNCMCKSRAVTDRLYDKPRPCEARRLCGYQRRFYPLFHKRGIPNPLIGMQHSLCRFSLLEAFTDAPEFLQAHQFAYAGQMGTGDPDMPDKALAELIEEGFVFRTHTAEGVPLYSGADKPAEFRDAMAFALLTARNHQTATDILRHQHDISD